MLFVGSDNSNTSGTSPLPTGTGISDTKGNTWYLRDSRNRTAGSAANDGCSYACYVTNQAGGTLTTGDTITITLLVTTTSKDASLVEVAGGAGNTVIFNDVNGAAGTGTSPTVTTTNSLPTNDAVVACCVMESNAAVTADADTSNGNWSTHQTTTASTGTAGTSQRISTQWKVVTGAGTQTYNPTTANVDRIVSYVQVHEQPGSTLTATSTGTATLLKVVNKPVAATSTGTATMTRAVTFGKILNVTSTGTATIVKQVNKILSVTSTGTPSITKIINKILSAVSTGTATITKIINKILNVTSIGTPDIQTTFISGGTSPTPPTLTPAGGRYQPTPYIGKDEEIFIDDDEVLVLL
jgi:hypothetical protein